MKGEDLYVFRGRVLDSMSAVLVFADNFPLDCKTDLEPKRREMLSRLEKLRETLKTKQQLTWHGMAEQETKAAFDALATGDRQKGRYLIQRAEEHLRRSFHPKKIRPRFIVGADGQATKQPPEGRRDRS